LRLCASSHPSCASWRLQLLRLLLLCIAGTCTRSRSPEGSCAGSPPAARPPRKQHMGTATSTWNGQHPQQKMLVL
jgi:hypothetical protein